MKTTAELKAEAKNALRGKWGQAVILNLIPTLLTVAVMFFVVLSGVIWFFIHGSGDGMISSVSEYQQNNASGGGTSLVSSIISALFMSGISWTYLDLLRGERTHIDPLKDAFRGFQGVFIGGVISFSVAYQYLYNVMDILIHHSWDCKSVCLFSKLLYLL